MLPGLLRILLFPLLLCGLSASAQYLPTLADGKHWQIRRDLGLGQYLEWNYGLRCDTVISGKVYFVIREMRSDTVLGFAREDTLNQEVFFLDVNAIDEIMIASYDLAAGDSIQLGNQYWHVDSTSVEYLYDAWRKVIYFNPLVRFIEGVGQSLQGLLNEPFEGPSGPFQYVSQIYPTTSTCGEIVATHDVDEVDLVRISPNPFQEFFTIDFTGKEAILLNIYSVSGELIMATPASPGDRINANLLPRGVYFLKSGQRNIHKLIKQ